MRQTKQTPFSPRLSLQRLTKKSYGLNNLLEQASQRTSLTDLFNNSVPALFINKFEVNGITNKILILTCHSAALMTRFQVNKNNVITTFNQKIKPQEIIDIKVKVRPKQFYPEINLQQKNDDSASYKKLSKKNAQILFEEAEHTDDLKLKDILKRLSQNSD